MKMAKKVDYPVVKKALWEAWRVFLLAFGAIIYATFEAGVNLKNWKAWIPLLGAAAIVAGFKAVFKWVRAKFFAGKYDNLIYKIPA